MKKPILYLILVILIILALISFRFGRGKETANIQVLENKKEIEETTGGIPIFPMEQSAQTQSFPIEQSAQTQLPIPENKPAITIINVRTPVKKVFSLNQDGRKINTKRIPEQELSASSSSLEAARSAGEDISEESANEAEGITKIEKYPSETEKKEMNERGIIVY